MIEFNNLIIEKLVKAIEIKEGELVLLHFWGDDKDRDVLHNFSCKVSKLGATPFEFQQSRETNCNVFNVAKETCYNEKYYNLFKGFDVIIDICMYKPVIPSQNLSKEKFNLYREYMSKTFDVLSDMKKFVQIRIPTEQLAKESNIEPKLFIEKMTNAYNIDYDELKKECLQKVESIKNKSSVCIKTSQNCELKLSLDNRKWFVDAGDGDLPCGEISIAPIEDKTNGTIYFDKLYLDDDFTVEKVILTVENGKIISSDSNEFNGFLKELPPNGNIIGELGIGMNKNVTELIGYEVLDEKMYGTFHLGIGMNTLFGGQNKCVMHMDFVGTGKIMFD
ncbi:aminopeptidase [Sedimentibacter sp. zth1]|uniref:aminopeptidase n=1 Tax=Sedimentibacter sp. zth1 TaxID=2816908 RepID=UPI001A92310C|nr:aminopeptidase [Sedimentibacter sp. zth1]QSX04828.1 aminopeptidase [Sedimentibacter sp. zth1]